MQEQKHVHAYAEDPLTVFLQPNCYHDWNHNMGCIKQAAAITASIGADMAKAEAVWLYIVSNFKYDAAFATEITAAGGKYNYSPDLESIYVDKSGICFGLSALYNSMLRSQGIPARMCHGYVNNIYHAWSEVWFYNKWVHVDTTFDMTSGKWVDGFLNYVISPDKYETKFIY
jgi:transglutaminase/protease-like cytokinesis protein 3